jgi:hypothetical protein
MAVEKPDHPELVFLWLRGDAIDVSAARHPPDCLGLGCLGVIGRVEVSFAVLPMLAEMKNIGVR